MLNFKLANFQSAHFFCFLLLDHFGARSFGANILMFAMTDSSSHRKSMFPLGANLVKSGHNVTMFADFFADKPNTSPHFHGKQVGYFYFKFEETDDEVSAMSAKFSEILWHQNAFKPDDNFLFWQRSGKVTEKWEKQVFC